MPGATAFTVTQLSQLPQVAQSILTLCKGYRVFAFYAPMGAGKTTLIKEMCLQLGSTDSFSSPTYSIVNEYNSPQGPLYHMDLYRLQSTPEAVNAGIAEYLSGQHYCFIEWPETAEPLLPDDYVKIEIKTDGINRIVRIFMD